MQRGFGQAGALPPTPGSRPRQVRYRHRLAARPGWLHRRLGGAESHHRDSSL